MKGTKVNKMEKRRGEPTVAKVFTSKKLLSFMLSVGLAVNCFTQVGVTAAVESPKVEPTVSITSDSTAVVTQGTNITSDTLSVSKLGYSSVIRALSTTSTTVVEDSNRVLGDQDIPDSNLLKKLRILITGSEEGAITVGTLGDYKGDANGHLDLSNLGITSIKGLNYAKSIKSIDLSKNNALVLIPESTFKGNRNINSIVLPDNLVTIGDSSFEGCLNLASVNLPENLTTIGSNAFRGCTLLQSVKLPMLISTIGDSAFSNTGLTSIDIPNPGVSLGTSVFNVCSNLKVVTLPKGMLSIPKETFKATAMESIILPDSIETIGPAAFSDSKLKSIDLTTKMKLTSIDYNAFALTPLLSVKLPESLTYLGYGAFEGCYVLPSIKIPSKVTIINESTFRGCMNLSNVEFTPEIVNGVMNYNVTEIKNMAFYQCPNLGGDDGIVDFLKELDKLHTIGEFALAACGIELKDNRGNPIKDASGRNIYGGITGIILPSKLTSLGKGVFSNNYNLRTIVMPDNLKSISIEAFFKCYSLKEVKLPSLLVEIGDRAFSECKELNSVMLPSTLEKIGENTFLNCANELLSSVSDEAGQTTKQYTYTGLEVVDIPDNVTYIGKGAFKGCYNLKSVKLPNNLTSLSDSLFEDCAIELKVLGENGEKVYKGLESVIFPDKMISIGNLVFENCYKFNLQAGKLNNNLKTIGSSAFMNCYRLDYIDPMYSVSVTSIGTYAFKNSGLSGMLTVPEKVTRIEDYVFDGCTKVTDVNLPSGLLTIGRSSFRNCSELKTVSMPASATFIYTGPTTSFLGCNKFKNAIINPVPEGVSLAENSELTLPVKVFNEINRVNSGNELIVTGEVKNDIYQKPTIPSVKGIGAGLTTVTVEGVIEYQVGSDPISGAMLVNRFTSDVTFRVNVTANKCIGVAFAQPVRGLAQLNTNGITLTPIITAEDSTKDTTDLKVWSSDNELIAKVDSNGRVTPVDYGTATIKLRVGNYEDSCQVKVCSPASSIKLDKYSETLIKGQTTTITPVLSYLSTYDGVKDNYPDVVTWTSSDTNVATVDAFGKIKAVGHGEATITARAEAGQRTVTCKIIVIPEVTYISLDKSELTILKGSTGDIFMTLNPADSPLSKISVTSSNTATATVQVVGDKIIVTGRTGGTAAITAKTVDGQTATCNVTIKSPLTGLTATSMELKKGSTRTVSINKTPYDATDKLVYTSSDINIVSVDETGLVTAKAPGIAKITITSAENNKITAECTVTVISNVTGITLDKSTLSMKVYEAYLLKATIAPEDASNKEVTWSSSKPYVATVDVNGRVIAVSVGTTIISVRTRDGNYAASCTVTVAAAPAGSKKRDVNSDGKVDVTDVSVVAEVINAEAGSSNYKSELDINSDNIIDIFDIVMVAQVTN